MLPGTKVAEVDGYLNIADYGVLVTANLVFA